MVYRFKCFIPDLCKVPILPFTNHFANPLKADDHKRTRELHEALLPIFNVLEASNDGGRDMPSAVKYAMERQGWRAGHPRAPMSPPGPGQRRLLDRALARANLVDG